MERSLRGLRPGSWRMIEVQFHNAEIATVERMTRLRVNTNEVAQLRAMLWARDEYDMRRRLIEMRVRP